MVRSGWALSFIRYSHGFPPLAAPADQRLLIRLSSATFVGEKRRHVRRLAAQMKSELAKCETKNIFSLQRACVRLAHFVHDVLCHTPCTVIAKLKAVWQDFRNLGCWRGGAQNANFGGDGAQRYFCAWRLCI